MKANIMFLISTLIALTFSTTLIYTTPTLQESQIIHENAELGKVCETKEGNNVIISKSVNEAGKTLLSKLDKGGNFIYHNSKFNLDYSMNAQITETKTTSEENEYTIYYKKSGKEYLNQFKDKGEDLKKVYTFDTYNKIVSALTLKNEKVFLAGIKEPSADFAKTTIEINIFDPLTQEVNPNGKTLDAYSKYISCAQLKDNEVYCAYVHEEKHLKEKIKDEELNKNEQNQKIEKKEKESKKNIEKPVKKAKQFEKNEKQKKELKEEIKDEPKEMKKDKISDKIEEIKEKEEKGKIHNKADENDSKKNLKSNLIMNEELFKILNNWINQSKNLKFELLFKASINGDSAENFHKFCDGKGPTITVIKGKNGHIFGGYLTKPFSSDGQSYFDDNAFLFSLKNMKKFPIKNKEPAVCHDPLWGPYFGCKDLGISSDCLSKISFCKPSSFTFKRPNLIGTKDNSFKTEDYEVYLVN